MRQGNGNDVLGANDPRSADVGIVYVSPNDDRKTVLAGILTQEKLGRRHIALVLPNQNKAFQRPVDFDDLKGLRRKLQAQLVLIAPVNSIPAELARQRRFTVFSSLETFANAVRSEAPQAEPKRSNGVRGLFGSARYKAALGQNGEATGQATNEPPVPPNDPVRSRRTSQALASREEEHEEDHSISNALAGAAILDAAEAARRESVNRNTSGIISDANSDEENVDGVDAMSFPGVPNSSIENPPRGDEGESLPPPTPVPSSSKPASRTGSKPSRAGTDPARTDPAPIDLKPAPGRVRDTAQLPPENAPASRRGGASRRRDNDKAAAAVAGAGAALGAAALAQKAASGSATKSGAPTRTRGAGGGGGSRGGVAGGGGPQGSNRRRLLLGIALIAAVLLVVLGSVVGLAYANPNAFGPLQSILPRGLPPATITITPDSKTVSNSYVILAVPNGQTNVNNRQVAARSLTSQQSTSKQINATGHTQISAAAAHGTLTFVNSSTSSVPVPAGQTITAPSGVAFVTDAAVTVPPFNPVTGQGGVNAVTAHAANPGAAGNIGSLAINGSCCNNSLFVHNNNAFTGGVDAKDYHFVQQSDVDAFVNGAAQQLTNQANSALRNQLKPGEQLAQATNCPSTMTNSDPIGDQGVNVTSSTVTVSVTCSAVAYDSNGMQGLVSQLLQKQAASSAGPRYALDGKVAVQSQVQQVKDDKTVSLVVTAKGLWVYQFSNQQKQQLAKLVAGKSINSAKAILQAQPGVHSVTISSNNATLPTDPNQIGVVIQSLSGVQGGTPTPFPTPPSKPATATPQPGRG